MAFSTILQLSITCWSLSTDKLKETAFDYKAFKEEQYDKLAAHVRKHVDLPLIYQILTDND